MTLASRLTALVQAIGADVKNLNDVAMLKAVDAASTGNVDITSAPATTAFDGVSGASWMTGRVLLHKQTNPAENGIWLYNAQGLPLTRAEDVLKIKIGQTVYVRVGNTYGGTQFASTKNVTGANQEWGFAPLPKQNSIAEPCMKAYTAQQSLTVAVLDGSFSGKRVLLTAQTNKQENGVYVYDANSEILVRVAGEIYTPGRLFPVVTQSAIDLDVDWANPEIWSCTEVGGSEGYTFTKVGGGAAGQVVDTNDIGTIKVWSRKTIPWEYVLANGQRLTRADYPQGYDCAVAEVAAGNPEWTYRASDETFTVPNLTDRFILAPGAPVTGRQIGARGGAETHQLSVAEMPTHAHTANAEVLSPTAGSNWAYTYTTASGYIMLRHTPTTNNQGGNQAHNNMPPYVVLAQLVKVRGATADATVIQGPQGPQGPPGPAGSAPQPWVTITQFLNNWVPYGTGGFQVPSYRVGGDGKITLRGLVKAGVVGQAAFVLPFAPPMIEPFAVMSPKTDVGPARLDVNPNGQVVPVLGSNVYFSLSGVSFYPN